MDLSVKSEHGDHSAGQGTTAATPVVEGVGEVEGKGAAAATLGGKPRGRGRASACWPRRTAATPAVEAAGVSPAAMASPATHAVRNEQAAVSVSRRARSIPMSSWPKENFVWSIRSGIHLIAA
ncbi:hypothetical protein ACP70R_036184 [Stipagrostis hirtigluma subsp. patula]